VSDGFRRDFELDRIGEVSLARVADPLIIMTIARRGKVARGAASRHALLYPLLREWLPHIGAVPRTRRNLAPFFAKLPPWSCVRGERDRGSCLGFTTVLVARASEHHCEPAISEIGHFATPRLRMTSTWVSRLDHVVFAGLPGRSQTACNRTGPIAELASALREGYGNPRGYAPVALSSLEPYLCRCPGVRQRRWR